MLARFQDCLRLSQQTSGEFQHCRMKEKLIYNLFVIMFQDGSAETNSLTKGSRSFNSVVMLIPACCDMVATSIMYVGLNLTYASSFQMLRGAVIVFTGILSVGFLNRKLGSREWFGIGLVIVGLALVGASDLAVKDNSDTGLNSILTGDLLIICAQVGIIFFTLISNLCS